MLVNNAAIAYKASDPTPFEGQTGPTLRINTYGTLALTDALLPLLREAAAEAAATVAKGDHCADNGPRLVHVASMAGALRQVSPALRERFASPSLTLGALRGLVGEFEAAVAAGTHRADGWGSSNYGLSKLAVIAATRVHARENPGILANCCCPGYCDTDMTSHGGTRPPAEGARNAVGF